MIIEGLSIENIPASRLFQCKTKDGEQTGTVLELLNGPLRQSQFTGRIHEFFHRAEVGQTLSLEQEETTLERLPDNVA
ncbi:MAG: hypothetical protein SFV17_03350 [Candidatus Obscuribacter sp.]|nr:hypothetical protein [Candidatus Melainabacteria bacterium]MDX1985702.1 hypothetical protein [Candidatus Obscuribacter sp.]